MLCANSIDSAISTLFGPSVTVVDRQRVSGGDINRAYRLELSDGAHVFLKCNRPDLLGMFTAEAEGLNALKATGTIGVPEPLPVGADGTGALLIMEYLLNPLNLLISPINLMSRPLQNVTPDLPLFAYSVTNFDAFSPCSALSNCITP